MVLSFSIAALFGLNVFQFITFQEETQRLERIISYREDTIAEKEHTIEVFSETIDTLRAKLDNYEINNFSDYRKLKFYDEYIALVTKDGTKKYHKYECEDYNKSSTFWAYNISAAESRGYYPCPKCH